MVIDVLVMRFHVGIKRFQEDISKIIEVHEENIFSDIGFTKEGRKVHIKYEYWKEGWIDEVESKFTSRYIKVMNDCKNS